MPVGMADFAPAQHRLRIDRQRPEITRLPEIVETLRRLGLLDGKEVCELLAVGRIKVEGMCRRNTHPRLVS